MFFLQVLFLSFTRLVKCEVEFNFGDADQNTTLESLDNSTSYSEKERQVGAVIHHAVCIPGKRPDPRSCNHYFLCVKNPPFVFTEYHLRCPPTLVYNPLAFRCVSPLFYNCVITAFPIPPPIPPPIRPPIRPPFPPPVWPPIPPPFPPPIWPPIPPGP
jgi:hypothetical protein